MLIAPTCLEELLLLLVDVRISQTRSNSWIRQFYWVQKALNHGRRRLLSTNQMVCAASHCQDRVQILLHPFSLWSAGPVLCPMNSRDNYGVKYIFFRVFLAPISPGFTPRLGVLINAG